MMPCAGVGYDSALHGASTHLEIHLPQLVAPLDEERGAHVEMELRERVGALGLLGSEQENWIAMDDPPNTYPTCAQCCAR